MDNLEGFIPKFLKGGWIVTLIGAAGMIARLAVSEEQNAMNTIIKNISAAMIASSISWFILEQFEINSMIKAITYGLVGLNSPELLTGIIKLSTKFSENPSEFISNIRSGSSVKPSSKPKPKPKPKPRLK